MFSDYTGTPRGISPFVFKQAVNTVSSDVLQRLLAKTIASRKTPPWQVILGQLYETSSKPVRAELLNALLELIPELRISLKLPSDNAVKPKDTGRISVKKLTKFASRIGSPKKAIDIVSEVYARNPPALRGLTPEVQGAIVTGLVRRGGVYTIVVGGDLAVAFDPAPDTGTEAETSFSAFARLDAPDTVKAGEPFDFVVGFGSEPDIKSEIRANSKIDVRATPGENMLVLVAAENGTILSQPNHGRLLLKLDAAQTFKAIPAAGVPYLRLSVEYLFRNVVVGTIARTLAVAGRPLPKEEPEDEDLFWPTMLAIAPEGVDLTLFVKLQVPGKITWQAVDRRSARKSKMIPVEIGDARSFAGELGGIQRKYGDKGFEAKEAINVAGARIADHIPEQIIDEFIAPLLKRATPLGVQILTNEPYIPWELAVLDPVVTGKDGPQFLGALMRVGRWWIGRRVPIPPIDLKVERISAIAADNYGVKANRTPLPQAKAEKEWLSAAPFNGTPVDGQYDPVIAWLKTLPIGPGHLAHFALHGYAVATANEQALVLGDGTQIAPAVLAGLRLRNQDPRFAMVFLNACQVGVAGESLGQIAGFPGDLLRAGTGALVGPLWEVNDVAAHKFATSFYEKTYKNEDRLCVSEALRQLREKTDGEVSLTPLAYIYYGHPGLTLSH